MRHICTLRSLYVAVGVLSVLCAGCKGPMAHNPASNASTTRESSAETPSTEFHHARTNGTNHPSPTVHTPSTVKQKSRVSSNEPDVVAETDEIFPDNISLIQTSFFSEIEETEDDAVVQEDGTSPDRPRVVAEPHDIFPDDISYVSNTAESDHDAVVRRDGTPLEQSHVVAETVIASLDDASYFSLVSEIADDGDSEIEDGRDTEPNPNLNLSTHTWPLPLLGNKAPYNTPYRPLQTGPSVFNRTSHSMSQTDISYLLGQSFNASASR
jgi:hypothetical protein